MGNMPNKNNKNILKVTSMSFSPLGKLKGAFYGFKRSTKKFVSRTPRN